MYRFVLLRHGESLWNQENRFTGWSDVGLSPKGELEAMEAGRALKASSFAFDLCFTSLLKRAIKTLWIVLEEMELMWIPVKQAWQLNERHYGALQGYYKAESIREHGEEQVQIWRRSFAVRPPLLETSDPHYPGNDSRYAQLAAEGLLLPLGESLKDTIARVIPFWEKEICPHIKADKSVLITAHGNSLRALIKHIEKISDEGISRRNVPTGRPLVYELDKNFKLIKHYYLTDPNTPDRTEPKPNKA